MKRKTEAAMAAGSVACVLVIGALMQGTETAEKFYGGAELAEVAQAHAVQLGFFEDGGMSLQNVTLTSAVPDIPVQLSQDAPVVRQERPTIPALVRSASPATPAAGGCHAAATLEPQEQGHLLLTVMAPCDVDSALTIRHEDLMFSARLDTDGTYMAHVPLLAEGAPYEISLGAQTLTARADGVRPQASHVILQWQGTAGFELHAREFGAAYGGDGHLWHGAGAGSTVGGWFSRLGDATVGSGHVADVYGLPAKTTLRGGQMDLSIEAEVTAANCGREIAARAMEVSPRGSVRAQEVTITVPDCQAVGDFLVLNNAFEDLKLAAR